ncbi:hypothetical protein F5B21DRAFT_196551 [Xylaria acuta]|nr:hypothetical protein F5B21DRAFT_196551 [Xylaria acuta]
MSLQSIPATVATLAFYIPQSYCCLPFCLNSTSSYCRLSLSPIPTYPAYLNTCFSFWRHYLERVFQYTFEKIVVLLLYLRITAKYPESQLCTALPSELLLSIAIITLSYLHESHTIRSSPMPP